MMLYRQGDERKGTYVEGKERLLLVSTGSHVDGDQLELELLLVKSGENAHGGGGHGDSVDFDAGHGDS